MATLDFEKVHEVRALLEVHIAGIAAERATEEDVAQLRDIHERMQRETADVEAAARDDLEFHRAIARATHNELFLLLMDSIGSCADRHPAGEPRLRLGSDDPRASTRRSSS